jgi:hypothetical protein
MHETPKLMRNFFRYSKAFESFKFLRPPPTSALVAARELTYAHFQLQTECQNMENSKSGKSNSSDQHNGKGDPEKTPAILQQTVLYNISRTNYFQRVSQTFRDARSRRALLCASTAMLAQQLTGINTIGKQCSIITWNQCHALRSLFVGARFLSSAGPM